MKGERSMKHDVTRILVETTVRRALQNARQSPEREIRNLIDESIEKIRSLAERHHIPLLTPKMGERIQPETSPTSAWWNIPKQP